MRDARRPALEFVAPVSGKVVKIERGARRKLVSLQIDVDESIGARRFDPPSIQDRDSLRGFMLATGVWSSLRTRPFANIPHPEGEPAAVFVTAMDVEPLAPGPQTIIDAHLEEFRVAVDALANISSASLYVCHASDYRPDLETSSRVQCVPFNGGRSAGLPGVHINTLCPIGFGGGEIWQIGYQDVIALGHLLLQGLPWLQRVISLGGDAVKRPRSLWVSPGAAIDELLADELSDGPSRILAGSEIYGRPLAASENYLATGQRQITVVHGGGMEVADETLARPAAIIPSDLLEDLAPPGIFPVPLMRALQLGDVERARDLGALELVEEDVAPLSLACVSNSNYGVLLRQVLDQLEASR